MNNKDARRENTFFGPPSPNAQRSPQPVGCTPTPAPDTWHHWWNVFYILQHAWAAAPEEVLASLKVAGVRGEVTGTCKCKEIELNLPGLSVICLHVHCECSNSML